LVNQIESCKKQYSLYSFISKVKQARVFTNLPFKNIDFTGIFKPFSGKCGTEKVYTQEIHLKKRNHKTF